MPQRSDEAPERNAFLNAIDFEIESRESVAAKHGVTSWAIVVAGAALAWSIVSELVGKNVTWLNILLIAFVVSGGIGFAVSLLIRTPLLRRTAVGTTWTFGHHLMASSGLDSNLVLRVAFLLACQALFGLLFWIGGLTKLGIALFFVDGFASALVWIIWILTKIRNPFVLGSWGSSIDAAKLRWRVLGSIVFRVPIAFALVYICRAWTNLAQSDVRIGFIAGALLTLIEYAVLTQSPSSVLPELHLLRTRVAFGWLPIGDAREELEGIFAGPNQKRILTRRACSVIDEVRQATRIFERLNSQINSVMLLIEELKSGSQTEQRVERAKYALRSFARAKSRVDRALMSRKKSKVLHAKFIAMSSEAEFGGEVDRQTVEELQTRLDAAIRERKSESEKFLSLHEQATDAVRFLWDVTGGIPPNAMPKGKLAIALSLFRE